MRFLPAFLFLLGISALTADVVRDLPYVRDAGPLQKLDVHRPALPSGKRLPVVVAIHGGGWKAGDKADPSFIDPLATWFGNRGFLVVSLNYRLSPAVRHPGHVRDVRAALAWIGKNIPRYGGDPAQIYLAGHSAGAHLAALAAVNRGALAAAGADPSALRGVLLFEGVAYDLPVQMRLRSPFPKTGGMYAAAFGIEKAGLIDASPVYQIDGTPPPVLLLHARMERSSRLQAKIFAHALRKAGGRPWVRSIWGKNHGNLLSTLLVPGDATSRELSDFLGLADKGGNNLDLTKIPEE
ncbi:MAG: alpha/beta hydrolase [Akkermansiaceae bacterium]|jgi:acetyl esterase/lipase|nr:alpha/beta hydrolase [Akkermansiaceae bacterium]